MIKIMEGGEEVRNEIESRSEDEAVAIFNVF